MVHCEVQAHDNIKEHGGNSLRSGKRRGRSEGADGEGTGRAKDGWVVRRESRCGEWHSTVQKGSGMEARYERKNQVSRKAVRGASVRHCAGGAGLESDGSGKASVRLNMVVLFHGAHSGDSIRRTVYRTLWPH